MEINIQHEILDVLCFSYMYTLSVSYILCMGVEGGRDCCFSYVFMLWMYPIYFAWGLREGGTHETYELSSFTSCCDVVYALCICCFSYMYALGVSYIFCMGVEGGTDCCFSFYALDVSHIFCMGVKRGRDQ